MLMQRSINLSNLEAKRNNPDNPLTQITFLVTKSELASSKQAIKEGIAMATA